ncbi:MAG: biopolymer transporter ExbD [Gammaproteobacteria bacterium]|nr:biopolymer transporter ExbD [Gammaproteobacteria bacterium]
MKLRSGTRLEPEINLTSLIDVVLLLLVFFMVTTSFVRESKLTIRLPEVNDSGGPVIQAPVLEITVSASGRYLVNKRALIDSRAETLRAAIIKLFPDLDVESVTITADAQASHQSVVTAMDVAGKLGLVNVNIATVSTTDKIQ